MTDVSAEQETKSLAQYLNQFKLTPIGEHEEGFDGHLQWVPDDPIVIRCREVFCNAYYNSDEETVKMFLNALLPTDDGRFALISQLLQNDQNDDAMKEVLLLAISYGSRPLTELLISVYESSPYSERSGCGNSHYFPPHMTPLMLACIMNNFSIVQCLLSRGHCIPMPHFRSCVCESCRRCSVHSRNEIRNVDIMRAVTSEAYLWLATDDVYVATCAIANDLRQMVKEDYLEYVETYRTLEANVQRFLARISDTAWRSEEFLTVMTSKHLATSRNCRFTSPRLQIAFDSKMRQFACTANVQTTITSNFWSDWRNFGTRFNSRDLGRIVRCTLLMPFIAVLHTIVPSAFSTFNVPAARFMAHQFSYAVFLVVTIFHAVFGNHTLHTGFEIYMYLYMIGLTLEKVMLCHRVGQSHFFSFWWRWYDAILITSFCLSLITYVGRLETYLGGNVLDASEVDRVHWPWCEPILLHEIFLSISCTIAIGKVFYYMQLWQTLGGSVISVGKCIGKVYTYIVIMLIVIFAFSIGMNMITSPYQDRKVHRDQDSDIATTSYYDSVGKSTKNLFWSIFGYLGPSSYVTAVGNSGPEMAPVEHYLNAAMLEILGALFHGIIIITLMNLMTSLLVKKADEVLDNEEMEFKYTRAMLYTEFLSWEMALPPPFNLFVVPTHFIYRRFGKSKGEYSKVVVGLEVEKHKKNKMMQCMFQMFERYVGSKECKFKSIWRTEFKDERLLSRVAFMNPLNPLTTQDPHFNSITTLRSVRSQRTE